MSFKSICFLVLGGTNTTPTPPLSCLIVIFSLLLLDRFLGCTCIDALGILLQALSMVVRTFHYLDGLHGVEVLSNGNEAIMVNRPWCLVDGFFNVLHGWFEDIVGITELWCFFGRAWTVKIWFVFFVTRSLIVRSPRLISYLDYGIVKIRLWLQD